jgi:hypothetical protein
VGPNARTRTAFGQATAAVSIEVPERAHLAPKTCLDRKMFPLGYIFLTFDDLQHDIPAREQRCQYEQRSKRSGP